MPKNRGLRIKSGAIAGLTVMTCFCCFFFRTRFPEFASIASSSPTALIAVDLRLREVNNVWSFDKDGMNYWRNLPTELMRK